VWGRCYTETRPERTEALDERYRYSIDNRLENRAVTAKLKRLLLPLALVGASLLGGCYYGPYAYGGYPRYYSGYYPRPVVVVGGGYYPYYRGY